MPRQQHIQRSQARKGPEIIDNRPPPPAPEIPAIVPDLPLRTVVYTEVGDMERLRVQYLLKQLSEGYADRGGRHYVVPVRNGKISTEVMFEHEILDMVKQICEIKDGEIVLRGGAQECQIVRQSI
jgi:hypothetical protein